MYRTILAVFTFLSLAHAQGVRPYLIDTFAGLYPAGDGGPATEALLEVPRGIVAGADGSVYISDSGQDRIRVVNPTGTISTLTDNIFARGLAMDAQGNVYAASNRLVCRITPQGEATIVAGNWMFDDAGDGGLATEAAIREANDVAVATDGTLYISDRRSGKVRRVAPDGIISTYAGTGTPGFSGDGGPATAAELDGPIGLALDAAGNLYITANLSKRVRVVAPDGTIATFAGNGERGAPVDGAPAVESPLRGPIGVGVDAAGNVYIADDDSNAILRVAPDGILRVIAGDGGWGFAGDGGPAVDARLGSPNYVSVDSQGNVYITDQGNHRIRRVDAGGTIDTFAGRSHFSGDGGPATDALLFMPHGVATDSRGRVYIADTQNDRIRMVGPDGVISTFAGNGISGSDGDGGLAVDAEVRTPFVVATGADDSVYFSNGRTYVRRIRSDGIIERFAGTGSGGDTGDGGPALNAAFSWLQQIAAGPDGSLYLADSNGNRVRRVSPDGTVQAFAGTGEFGFSGDGGPAVAAQVNNPIGLAVDALGNVYIGDSGNSRIRKVDPSGTISTIAGNGQRDIPADGLLAAEAPFKTATGIAFDHDGSLVVAAFQDVFKITTAGRIYRIAGQGVSGFSGDGGLATEARLFNAYGVAVGPGGVIYVADEGNHRIRRLTPDPPARLEAANGATYSGLPGYTLGNPLAVRVIGTTGLPLPGVTVFFVVTSGDAVLAAGSAVADTMGVAGVLATLGTGPGQVTVTASIPGLAPVELTITSISDPNGIDVAPAVSAGGVVGAGLSVPSVRAISPNGIVSIFGSAFAPPGTIRQVGPADLVNGMLPTNLVNVCVSFGDQFGHVLHVFENQLNVQVPTPATGQMTDVRVIQNCGLPAAVASDPESVLVEAVAPEFIYWVQNLDGINPVAAVNPITGDFIGAPGLVPGVSFVRARPGDLVDMYATGFGPMNNIVPGQIPTQAIPVVANVRILLGGDELDPADILYTGSTQYAGVYLVRIRIPSGTPEGDITVRALTTIDSLVRESPPGSYLAITDGQ